MSQTKNRKRNERRERSEPPGANAAQGSEAKEPPELRLGNTRLKCPWWWCDWFRSVLPQVHNHPKNTPPWWRHTVDLSPAQAKRIMEIARRSVESGDPAILPPPDLLEEAVRHALLTESGGALDFPDQRVEEEMRRLLGGRRE